MNKLNKKQLIILATIIFSMINISLLSIVTISIFNSNSKQAKIIKKDTYNIKFLKKDYYIGIDETIKIDIENNDNIKYTLSIDDINIANINNNEVTGLNNGSTEIILTLPNNTILTSNINVVKGMVKRPNEFNYEKNYIECNYFSNEENELLDKALKDRINSVTYQTRASVVEAARFLTLSFNYRIPYFYENGRLNNYGGKEHVDGEGRYYHKGLYLSESKYNEITAILYGPQSWD